MLKKVIYFILCGIAIAGLCILSSLLLFSGFTALKYISLASTYLFGIYVIRQIHKYPLKKA